MASWCDGLFRGYCGTAMKLSIQLPEGDISKWPLRAQRIRDAKEIILKKSVLLIERHAKIFSPVDTGRMRASIGGGGFIGGSFSEGEGIEFGENFASIGPTVEYAPFIESRTPFMGAAATQALPEIQKIAQDEIHKALR